MEYKPRVRRKGINLPFGYYVCPTDDTVLIPDAKKLDALHYAFRMRAKYKTPLRDCCMWLHSATGQRMTAAGFLEAYRRWVKFLNKDKRKEVLLKMKEAKKQKQKLIEENFKQFGINLDDRPDITALAAKQAEEKWKREKNSTN